MIQSLANFLQRRQQKWNSGQMLSSLTHSSLEVHCSYRLKFFVAKNHLRSSSPSNCNLLCSRFARSCSPRPSQRSKYTEGVALRMRICIAVQRLSRKWVQKKYTPDAEVWHVRSSLRNVFCTSGHANCTQNYDRTVNNAEEQRYSCDVEER